MPKRALALITLAAFLIATSGCTRYVPATVPEIKRLPPEKQEALDISSVQLNNRGEVTFAKFGLGKLKGEEIRGLKEINQLELREEDIADIQRGAGGSIHQITTKSQVIYKVSSSSGSAGVIYIDKGSILEAIPLADVVSMTIRKTDGASTILLILASSSVLFFFGYLYSATLGSIRFGNWSNAERSR